MLKKTFALFLTALLISGNGLVWSEKTPDVDYTPTVVAPGGLSQKEQSSLQRQYQFGVRNKSALLSPYFTDSNVSGQTGQAPSSGSITEEAALYKYFDAAAGLYNEGKYAESAEVLNYILDKDPGNDYVRAYLDRVKRSMHSSDKKLEYGDRKTAAAIKRTNISNLMTEGKQSYNNRDFDTAVFKFSEVLKLDPDNATAKNYISRLKKQYAKDTAVEDIVQNWTIKNSRRPEQEESIGINNMAAEAEKLMEQSEIKNTDAEMLMRQAEAELKVVDIIKYKYTEDRRAEQFTIGSGDVLQIDVLGHPEFSGRTTVRVKGDIVLPLINERIGAVGLTADELAEKVKDVLQKYVQDPVVEISIAEFRSKVFYVIDEDSCTPYPISRSNMTLRDALFISDWGNNRALGRVMVISPSKGVPIIRKIDAFNLIYRGDLKDNIRINDGDVIYVPMTIVAKVTKTIFDVIGPFRAIRSARDEYLNLKWNQKDWRRMGTIPATYDQEAEDAKNLNTWDLFEFLPAGNR